MAPQRSTIRTGTPTRTASRAADPPPASGSVPTPSTLDGMLAERSGSLAPRWFVIVLSGAGVLLTAYLTWLKVTNAEIPCVGVAGCDTVQNSPYAEFLGIPLQVVGLGMYLAIGLLGLLWLRGPDPMSTAGLALFGLAVLGVGYSAYLTYLELFVIHAVCSWCVASAALLLAILGSTVWGLTRSSG